ncbi:GDSL esterase/lipase EXL3-like [Panicum miliaceum]|uniref:GDSL esterase/lipase EXL3-like n=1 Tax=Panicum miliaceum TaxID=4540 RepID=A0A3L6PFB8_PANMI|nr:GDSL esterase/lipase EXL3-like [Panicum miliaceum]
MKSPAAGSCRSPIERCRSGRVPVFNSCRAADATRNHRIMHASGGVTAAARAPARLLPSTSRARYKTGAMSRQQLQKRLANNGVSDYLSWGPFLVAPAASKLGVKELLPPFLGDDLELKDLLTGVAFACGGSGYDLLTSKLATTLSSTDQLDIFRDYKEKLRALVGEEEMTRVISKAVYFTVMGENDILNNYFIVPLRRHEYDLPSYVDFLVSSTINFTKTLNDMGAKRIGFVGVPPLGCCPSQITLGGSPSRQCEPLRNQASRLFNSRISQEIEILNAERSASGSKIAYFDIYYNLLDLIQNPALYGFKDVKEGCCGSTVLNAAVFIAYHSACPNVIDYIFWDGFHPTEKAYNIVVDKLIQQNMKYLM